MKCGEYFIRLYGPEEEFFNGTWKLVDIVKGNLGTL